MRYISRMVTGTSAKFGRLFYIVIDYVGKFFQIFVARGRVVGQNSNFLIFVFDASSLSDVTLSTVQPAKHHPRHAPTTPITPSVEEFYDNNNATPLIVERPIYGKIVNTCLTNNFGLQKRILFKLCRDLGDIEEDFRTDFC